MALADVQVTTGGAARQQHSSATATLTSYLPLPFIQGGLLCERKMPLEARVCKAFYFKSCVNSSRKTNKPELKKKQKKTTQTTHHKHMPPQSAVLGAKRRLK